MLLLPMQLLDMGGGEIGAGSAAAAGVHGNIGIGLRIGLSVWVLAPNLGLLSQRLMRVW